MAIFPEAENRLHKNVYICKKCERKFKTTINKVLNNEAVCRFCKSKNVRPKRMKAKK